MPHPTQLVVLCLMCLLLVASQSAFAFTPGKLSGESADAMKKRMMEEALRLKSSAKMAAMEHGRNLASAPRPAKPTSHAVPKVPGPLGVPRSVPRMPRVRRLVEHTPLPGKIRLQRLKELPLKRITKKKMDNCNNKVHDLDFESDVDCGGICINALKMINHHQQPGMCEHGQKCKNGEDCKSGQCTSEGQCQARRFLEERSDDTLFGDIRKACVDTTTANSVPDLYPNDVLAVVVRALNPDQQDISDEHMDKIKVRVNAFKDKEGLMDHFVNLKVEMDYISRGKPFAFIKALREELDRN